jgi:hypothetical protein
MDERTEQNVMSFVEKNIDAIPFKTLRYGEVELGQEEKLKQMRSTLHNDPSLFLSKWGRHLSQNTLRLFQVIKGNYEVDFYLDSLLYQEPEDLDMTSLRIQHDRAPPPRKSAMRQLAQNRRYEFLQRKLRLSDYFSDESIQLREPVLYDQYVGQHIPANEKSKPFEKDVTLVNRIFSNMDRKFVEDHLYEQKVIDEEQLEEEEDDEDEEDESDQDISEKSTPIVVTKKKNKDIEMEEANDEKDEKRESDEESEQDIEALIDFREEQRQELIRLLEEKFLDGKDVSEIVREYE